MMDWGTILLGKPIDKIEHEGTCAKVGESQDADNTDQNVKWFLKVHIQTFVGSIFLTICFSKFYSSSHFTNVLIFTPLKMRVQLKH